MMRRHLSDRILSVCAVALLGSLALVPTQTLAHGSDGSMAASQQGHGHDPRGDRGHDREGSPASNHAGAGRTGACTRASDDRGNNACNGDQSRQGGGAAASGAKGRPGAPATAAGGAVAPGTAATGERGTPAGVATASSTSRVPAGTGALPSAHGVALTQGVNLPGTPVHISRPPASAPGGVRPAAVPPAVSAPPPHPVLGPVPVPVLVPSIGVTVPPASALSWAWFIALAIVGIVLAAFFVARRRRAGSRPL
jgi:hypothetical protein